MSGDALHCAGCRLEIIGGWEAGDGRIFCGPCIRESLATAEVAELNRRLMVTLRGPLTLGEVTERRIRDAAMARAIETTNAAEPPHRAERIAKMIHRLAHGEGVDDCLECG